MKLSININESEPCDSLPSSVTLPAAIILHFAGEYSSSKSSLKYNEYPSKNLFFLYFYRATN